MIARMKTAALISLCAAGITVAGCGDPVGAVEGDYQLIRINEESLPAQHPFSDLLLITAGTLVLRPDGTAEETLTARCRQNLPPGTSCQVTQPQERRTGTYSRNERWLRLGGSAYSLAFERNRVTIEYTPAGADDFSRATMVYER
jgi:hypothetical protein